jgi:tetratricopeptide (TPR) repeat protein
LNLTPATGLCSNFYVFKCAPTNYELGDTILWSGTAENAIPYLENAIKYSPENKAAHDSLGRAYMRAGQTEKAIPQFKAALGLDKEGTIYYQLAQAYRETGQKELAMQTMQEFERISKAAKARRPQEIYQITPP